VQREQTIAWRLKEKTALAQVAEKRYSKFSVSLIDPSKLSQKSMNKTHKKWKISKSSPRL